MGQSMSECTSRSARDELQRILFMGDSFEAMILYYVKHMFISIYIITYYMLFQSFEYNAKKYEGCGLASRDSRIFGIS